MKNCAKCGEINTSDSNFCINCGNDTFDENAETICPVCNTPNTTDSVYCINCGAILINKSDASLLIEPKTDELTIQEPSIDHTICAVCGAKLKVNDVFCSNCGSVVSEYNKNTLVKRKICPKCNRPNEMSNNYCSYCFTDLAEADTEDFTVDFVEGARNGDEVIKQAVLVTNAGKKSRICSNCGTVNDVDQLYCAKCGTRQTIGFTKKYCLVCGTENNYDAQFCIKCQYSFVGKKGQILGSWKCICGELNDSDSNYCSRCGVKKPKK